MNRPLSNPISICCQAKVVIAEQTEKDIDVTRSQYIPVAIRTQILFFCTSDLVSTLSKQCVLQNYHFRPTWQQHSSDQYWVCVFSLLNTNIDPMYFFSSGQYWSCVFYLPETNIDPMYIFSSGQYWPSVFYFPETNIGLLCFLPFRPTLIQCTSILWSGSSPSSSTASPTLTPQVDRSSLYLDQMTLLLSLSSKIPVVSSSLNFSDIKLLAPTHYNIVLFRQCGQEDWKHQWVLHLQFVLKCLPQFVWEVQAAVLVPCVCANSDEWE